MTAKKNPPWLTVALAEVGYHEGPNNHNKFGVRQGMDHEPWCDLFVADCCERAGTPLPSMQPGMKTGAAAVIYSIRFAKAHDLWVPSWKSGPGFQICYGWNGPNSTPDKMHTGFIVKVGPSGSVGYTVEGNRADQVERQTFTVGASTVLGCIDLPRLLGKRPQITIHEPKPAPQPRHPAHSENTGPHNSGVTLTIDGKVVYEGEH